MKRVILLAGLLASFGFSGLSNQRKVYSKSSKLDSA